MKKLKEFLQLFFILLAFISFIAIAGIAGASDLHNTPFELVKARAIPVLIIFVISCIFVKKLGSDTDDSEMY